MENVRKGTFVGEKLYECKGGHRRGRSGPATAAVKRRGPHLGRGSFEVNVAGAPVASLRKKRSWDRVTVEKN